MRKVPFNNFTFISLNDIINWEKNNDYLKTMINAVKPSDSFYLFNKNYIGFKNYEELEQFKKIFKEDNYKDNPLFKFSKALRPGLATIIINFILIILMLIFAIVFFFVDTESFVIFSHSSCCVLSLIYFLIFIPLFSIDKKIFKTEQFTFDFQIESVLNSFNKRNKQPVYLASIILISICTLPPTVLIVILLIPDLYKLIRMIKDECSFCSLC